MNHPEHYSYLFLDFDGVLNHEQFNLAWYNKIQAGEATHQDKPDLDEKAVQYLNDLITDFPNLQIVISSTWRASGKQYCIDALVKVAFAFPDRILDCTPLSNHRVRGVEVLEWLRKYTSYSISPVDYVILDDDSDFLIWQQPRFICVDPYAGLTHNHVYRVSRILNRLN